MTSTVSSSSSFPNELTARLAAATQDGRIPSEPARLPETIGRYRVHAHLGMGGTGAVYDAYDPSLDRPVAIKVPRRKHRGVGDEEALSRLIREAQTLAAIVHPNVVEVYDVGSDPSISDAEVFGVYIVMERLDGTHLRKWMGQARSWREVVAVFLEAGRGLVAAHAQRVLHRDFKPENVMVTSRGQVKVLDFGLARAAEGGLPLSVAGSGEIVSEPALPGELTDTGIVMGTPRYMAPEQHAAQKVTEASDQYAFCVAMLEALQGRPVFQATSLAEMHAAKLRFRSLEGEASKSIPAWLRRILERGLSPKAGDRWPSMVELLRAIERGASGRRRMLLWGGSFTAACVAAVGWFAPSAEDVCSASARTGDPWDRAHAESIARAFEEAEPSRGAAVAREVSDALDARARTWASIHEQSCVAYRSGAIDGRAFDRRMQCLRSRRAEVQTLIEQLARADHDLVARAAEIPAKLASPETCSDDELLASGVDVPTGAAARRAAIEIEESLARVDALLAVHRPARALEEIEHASVQATRLAHRPTWLRVSVRHAEALVVVGRFDDAVELVEPVLFECESSGHDQLALDAMMPLLFALVELGRAEEALERFPQALVLAERARASAQRRARLIGMQASVLAATGRLQEARVAFEQAIEEMAEAVGEREPEVQALLNNYGNLLEKLGEVDAAIEIHRRGLWHRERERGTDHPSLLAPVTNLAAAYVSASRYDDALVLYERARALSLSHYGPEHVKHHHALVGMGVVLKKMGRYEEAVEQYEHALAIIEGNYGLEHPTAAMLVANVANARKRMGHHQESLELHRRALDIRERILGSDHKDVATSHQDIADALRNAGRLREARRHLERARQILEKTFGPDHVELGTNELVFGLLARDEGDIAAATRHLERSLDLLRDRRGSEHPSLADPSCHLGALMHEVGRLEAAVEHLRRCARLREAGTVAPALVGAARFDLARAQWALGDRDAARASARAAIEAFEEGTFADDLLEEARAWLTAQGGRAP